MKTSQLAHDLVTDVAHTLVPDLLLAQQVRDCSEADEEEIDRLRAQNARLAAALESSCRYLDKAEADGLMQGCAVRPQHAAAKYRALLAEIDKGAKS